MNDIPDAVKIAHSYVDALNELKAAQRKLSDAESYVGACRRVVADHVATLSKCVGQNRKAKCYLIPGGISVVVDYGGSAERPATVRVFEDGSQILE